MVAWILLIRESYWPEFETFCTVESPKQFFPDSHSPLTISMQIWTNYETHLYKKWEVRAPRVSVVASPVMKAASRSADAQKCPPAQSKSYVSQQSRCDGRDCSAYGRKWAVTYARFYVFDPTAPKTYGVLTHQLGASRDRNISTSPAPGQRCNFLIAENFSGGAAF